MSIEINFIPAYRISNRVSPEIRVYSSEDALKMELSVIKKDEILKKQDYKIDKGLNRLYCSLEGLKGRIKFSFEFFKDNEKVHTFAYNYEVIDSSCRSTTLIDGCWVSIYHWSEDEARWFNKDLRRLTDEDWKDKIRDMNRVGIKGVIIQNLFYCNEYAGQHDMTVETYRGKAFYPSKIYPERFDIAAKDPVEAILSAADECEMNVFLGVGLFAWFDFSEESLKWHKRVTEELFEMYGHHKSLYGWYISEEMFGSLYYEYPYLKGSDYKNIVNFFEDYTSFVRELTPTKPVALAPNNIRFHEFEKEWKEILVNVDILIPFAFARDPEHLNIKEIADICNACGTHFWVDMEMFAWPLDNGLVPKSTEELIKEIRMYDDVEQIYGYQYTGIMNSPDFKYELGGEKTRELYTGYYEYYRSVMEKMSRRERG